MRYLLLVLALLGCDPETVCYQPSGDPCPPPVTTAPDGITPEKPDLSAYPWIWTVRTSPMQWSLSCDMPEEMAATVREAAGWWGDLFVKGIMAPESPCDAFVDRALPGLQIDFKPDPASPYGALGGFDPTTGHAGIHILKGHYSRVILGIVVMHELGHALGLGHVDEPGCLMYRGAASDYGSGLCQIEQMGLLAAYPTGFPASPHPRH